MLTLTKAFTDTRAFIGLGLLLGSFSYYFEYGLLVIILLSLLAGLFMFISAFNGTRHKTIGKISTVISVILISIVAFMADNTPAQLILFYIAIGISFQVIRLK